MHRFYLTPDQCRGTELVLSEREAHHAADVLRLRRGDAVTVLNGEGDVFFCVVQEVGRKRVVLHVQRKESSPPPPCRITLAQAIPKGKLIEDIIEKATELGVSEVVPLLSERVTTHLDQAGAEQKAEKWQQVAIEATKQCGQAWLPRVRVPVKPSAFLAQKRVFDLGLVGSLQGDGRHPREYFQNFFKAHGKMPESVCIWIGPEGDFSPAELDAIRAGGTSPITLGNLVLRCETAAVYAMSVVTYELGANTH